MLQYDTSSYHADNKCNLREYRKSFSSKDGFKEPNSSSLGNTQGEELPAAPVKSEESGSKRKKNLDRSYVSFNGVKDDKNHHAEKGPEKLFKSVLPRLVPSMSFNEKTISGPQAHRKKSSVIRLSFKRKSLDGEEISETREYLVGFFFLVYYKIS